MVGVVGVRGVCDELDEEADDEGRDTAVAAAGDLEDFSVLVFEGDIREEVTPPRDGLTCGAGAEDFTLFSGVEGLTLNAEVRFTCNAPR